MFDIIFDGFGAFQQVLLFLTALFFFALGGALFSNDLYWRLRGLRVQGTVVGVRKKSGSYTPVYRYMLPSGDTFEATSNTGSNLTKGKETYSTVPLMVFPEDPLTVCPVNSYAAAIIGFIMMGIGTGLAYVAFRFFPVTWMSWAMLVAMLLYAALGFRKLIIPKAQRLAPADWKIKRREKREVERAAIPIRQIEDILASPEAALVREQEKKNARFAAPFILMFAVGLLYGGYHEYGQLSALEKNGIRAEGAVTGIEEKKQKSGSLTYYPLVTFTDGAGKTVTFKSWRGGNPPLYKTGDKVQVLYLAQKPQDAKIYTSDHFWSKVMPMVLYALGGLLFFLFLKVLV